MTELTHERLIAWRGICGEVCQGCGGSGIKTYPNTATYHRGGIAGRALTADVCDECWGSGDISRAWPNRLSVEQQLRELRALEAVQLKDVPLSKAAIESIWAELQTRGARNAPLDQELGTLAAVSAIVRERMNATVPACMTVMGEADSRTLRRVEALLFPPGKR